MTQANSRKVKKRWKKRGKSIMKLLKFELFGMQKACQSKAQLKVCQLISTGIITKTISRMCSGKADISSAIVIQIL